MRPLEELEHWMQGEIVRPHEGRARTRAERDASAVPHVRPSAHLTPGDRVEIYADMYFARLLEVLADDYPAVRALAGPVEFERIVRDYLREHPSRHWSLSGLGHELPEFLAGKFRAPRKALLHDVARLENAMSIVFDAPRSEVLTPADMTRVPPDAFADARLVCVDALELHTFDHRANAIVRAVRQDESMPALTRHRTFTVVWRKEWVVWRMDLDEPMFHLLSGLREGRTVRNAIESTSARFRSSPEGLQAAISRSFGEWIAEGLFARVVTG